MHLTVTTSLTPNLLSHIYACSGLTDNPQYSRRFKDALREEDISFLKSLEPHFRHRPPVAGGPFFTFLYQIPSYFPADDLGETLRTFDMLLEGLRIRSTTFPGIDHDTLQKLQVWIPPEITAASRRSLESMLPEVTSILERLKEIVSHTYLSFYEQYWNENKMLLLEKARKIQDSLIDLSIFDVWSEILGLPFPYTEFVVYLCEARLGATSLLAEKIALPSSITLDRASETIIHEAGIHFISPKDYLNRGVTPETFLERNEDLSRMEEAAICYLKPQVYSRLGIAAGSDYHIPLMKIEKEMETFSKVWKLKSPENVIDGVLEACNLP